MKNEIIANATIYSNITNSTHNGTRELRPYCLGAHDLEPNSSWYNNCTVDWNNSTDSILKFNKTSSLICQCSAFQYMTVTNNWKFNNFTVLNKLEIYMQKVKFYSGSLFYMVVFVLVIWIIMIAWKSGQEKDITKNERFYTSIGCLADTINIQAIIKRDQVEKDEMMVRVLEVLETALSQAEVYDKKRESRRLKKIIDKYDKKTNIGIAEGFLPEKEKIVYVDHDKLRARERIKAREKRLKLLADAKQRKKDARIAGKQSKKVPEYFVKNIVNAQMIKEESTYLDQSSEEDEVQRKPDKEVRLNEKLFRVNVKNPYLEQMDFEEKIDLHFSSDDENHSDNSDLGSQATVNVRMLNSRDDYSTSQAYHDHKAANIFGPKEMEENPYLKMSVESNIFGKYEKENKGMQNPFAKKRQVEDYRKSKLVGKYHNSTEEDQNSEENERSKTPNNEDDYSDAFSEIPNDDDETKQDFAQSEGHFSTISRSKYSKLGDSNAPLSWVKKLTTRDDKSKLDNSSTKKSE